MTDDAAREAARLEALWAGAFGDEYVERNEGSYDRREEFWREMVDRLRPSSVLEVGCNMGGNLRWIAPLLGRGTVVGVDVNHSALSRVREGLPSVGAVRGAGRDLPLRDRAVDLAFTMGVLMHQPEAMLPLVMSEVVRCSDRFVLVGEYYAEQTLEVPYRGHSGALFKRDYGALFTGRFPALDLVGTGFLSRETGWDDVTWWLFERT